MNIFFCGSIGIVVIIILICIYSIGKAHGEVKGIEYCRKIDKKLNKRYTKYGLDDDYDL